MYIKSWGSFWGKFAAKRFQYKESPEGEENKLWWEYSGDESQVQWVVNDPGNEGIADLGKSWIRGYHV